MVLNGVKGYNKVFSYEFLRSADPKGYYDNLFIFLLFMQVIDEQNYFCIQEKLILTRRFLETNSLQSRHIVLSPLLILLISFRIIVIILLLGNVSQIQKPVFLLF